MVFGIFLCLDAFLYVLTLLPLRVCLALFRLFALPCYGLRYVGDLHGVKGGVYSFFLLFVSYRLKIVYSFIHSLAHSTDVLFLFSMNVIYLYNIFYGFFFFPRMV